jgi:GTPase SAR1 family protein
MVVAMGAGEPGGVLHLPARALLVVGGLPGAGKSTLLRRLFPGDTPGVTVLDPEHVQAAVAGLLGTRRGYRLYRPLVHLWHGAAVVLALRVPGAIVVHSTATRGWDRRLLAWAARGRTAHLLFLQVEPGTALAGQRARGRRLTAAGMRRHVRREARLRAELAAGTLPGREGFATVTVVDRAGADALEAVTFGEVAPQLV